MIKITNSYGFTQGWINPKYIICIRPYLKNKIEQGCQIDMRHAMVISFYSDLTADELSEQINKANDNTKRI